MTLERCKNIINSCINSDYNLDINSRVEYICNRLHINYDDMFKKSRKSNIVYYKQIIYYVLYNRYLFNQCDIGRLFGYDHSTINYHIKYFTNILKAPYHTDKIRLERILKQI